MLCLVLYPLLPDIIWQEANDEENKEKSEEEKCTKVHTHAHIYTYTYTHTHTYKPIHSLTYTSPMLLSHCLFVSIKWWMDSVTSHICHVYIGSETKRDKWNGWRGNKKGNLSHLLLLLVMLNVTWHLSWIAMGKENKGPFDEVNSRAIILLY